MRLFAWIVFGLVPSAAAADEDSAEEIVVWGDLFARWDDTRWYVTTEFALPFELTLARDENISFQTRELELRTIVACEKEWKLGKRRYEVACKIEDFGIQAAIAERVVTEADAERAQLVLNEVDAKLTGASLSLQVADDGRVPNLDLDGIDTDNRRQSEIQETLRQVLSRVVVGFNLKMQKYNQLHEGKWAEYNSTVMTMPLPPGVSGSMGSNMLVHHLNHYRGHVIVQSIGKGMTSVEVEQGQMVNFTTDFIGVSTFDDQEGFMTERVWALDGTSTASAFFAQGTYFNAGKITMLGDADRPDCRTTAVVNGRHQHLPFLPEWTPHDS
jgi:hypothetical protein